MKSNLSRKVLVLLLSLALFAVAASTAFSYDLDQVLRRGVVRVGIFTQDPPRQFLDPKTGELVGFEADIAAEFAKTLGVKLELVPAEWDALIPGLLADKWDIIIANMARLPSRAVTVDFTLAFENAGYFAIAVRSNDDRFTKLADLNKKGIRLGTGRGNAAEKAAMEEAPNATIVPFASPQLAVQALIAGQVDAVPEDYEPLAGFAQHDRRIKVVGEKSYGYLMTTGFAVKPGNFRLWLWANLFLVDFKNSGGYLKLREKWYPGQTPPETAFEVR